MPINMIAESATTLSPQVLVLRVALWLAGATLLWVGGRFIAKIPRATFRRSLLTYFLAGIACFVLSWIFLASLWYLNLGSRVRVAWLALAVGLGLTNLLIVWIIIKAMFGTSFKKAILAWLPTLVVLVITSLPGIRLLLPSLYQPGRIVVSHETTRLLGPVNADGTVNYLEPVPGLLGL